MIYRSTRSSVTASPAEAILAGIAPDGGLFLPREFVFEGFDAEKTATKDFYGIAEDVLYALFPEFSREEIAEIVRLAYTGKFETEDLTPTVPVGDNYVLELFRGPTCAFKDVALSVLPHLMTASRAKCGETDEIVILTATSGDTGKAALKGFQDVPGTKILVFYPHGGVSAVQRAQMVTQKGENTFVSAIRGNFDDAQTGVKRIFGDFAAEHTMEGTGARLSSANSINIGRLAPQIVYYFKAYGDLMRSGRIAWGDEVDFVVPTGNFGNILAGYFARIMGLPVGKLVCASNANNVLTDFIRTGTYDKRRPFYLTQSPSMDILVSSNLERLLFLLSDGDDKAVAGWMAALSKEGVYTVPETLRAKMNEVFVGYCYDDKASSEVLGRVLRETGYLCDPHTAVAYAAAEEYRRDSETKNPVVVLATASPFKFSRPVLAAMGEDATGDEFDLLGRLSAKSGLPVPSSLAELSELPERHGGVIEKDEMADFVLEKIGSKKGK
ncbi:MAG: threonine synthase [Clostridia bacterium]|nr:threonine synthase [Clostridia bacterium]